LRHVTKYGAPVFHNRRSRSRIHADRRLRNQRYRSLICYNRKKTIGETNMNKIPVGVLGATGTVGQRFVQLLADHAWLEVVAVTGSDRTVGRPYGEGVNWLMPGAVPTRTADLVVQPTRLELGIPGNPPVVFSALPTTEAKEWEPQFAAAGYAVITNTSVFR